MPHYPTTPLNGDKIGANLCPRPKFPDLTLGGWSTGTVAARDTGGGVMRNRLAWTGTTAIALPAVPNSAATFTVDVFYILTTGNTASVGLRPAGSSNVTQWVALPNTAGTYQRQTVQLPYAAIAGAATLELWIQVSSANQMGLVEIRLDYDDSTIDGYFDGATADTADADFGWDGTANASTSRANAIVAADTAAPSAPGLTETGHGDTSVELSWSAATDNVAVAGYRIYDGGALVDTGGLVVGTARLITGLTPGSAHVFTVTAVDTSGNESAPSNAVNVTTDAAPDTTAPTVPTGLTVTGTSATTISLAWSASTDEVGVTAYEVYEGATLLGTVVPPDLAATVTGLIPGTVHEFTVRALDAEGNASAHSAPVMGVTEAPAGLDAAATVAAFLGAPDDESVLALAAQVVPVITMMAKAYTRDQGFTGGEPNDELAAVITTASARMVANPEQLDTTVGSVGVRGAFQGWNLAELAVLNRYRRRAA